MADSEQKWGGEGVKSARAALMELELLTRSETPVSFAEIAAALGHPCSASLFLQLDTPMNRHTNRARASLRSGDGNLGRSWLLTEAKPKGGARSRDQTGLIRWWWSKKKGMHS